MRCRTARRMLSAYLDGDLAEVEQARVAAHLEGCTECRAEASALKGAASALRTLSAVGSAPELTDDLRRRLAARAPRRLSWRWACAGVAAVAAVAVWFWLAARPQPVAPRSPARQAVVESPPVEQAAPRVVEPQTETPAPGPPRPVRHVARPQPAPPQPVAAGAPSESAPTEFAPDDSAAPEAAESIAGVVLLLGSAEPKLPSSRCYLEVTLPDGSKSVHEENVERDAAGRPRTIQIACEQIAPETPGTNSGG